MAAAGAAMILVLGLTSSGCRELTGVRPDAGVDGSGDGSPLDGLVRQPGAEVGNGKEVVPPSELGGSVDAPGSDGSPIDGPPPDAPAVDAPAMEVAMVDVAPGCVPTGELCDGKDNDCNGKVDEGLQMACATACGGGTRTCSAGTWGECSARIPSAEICDNQDNDCDGLVDDDLSRDCSTTCEAGKEICSGGKWGTCSARKPSSTDVNSCGTACVRCNAAPTHGKAACIDGHCDFTCNEPGFTAKCNGQCAPCCGGNAGPCGAGVWTCSNNQCQCPGLKCGGRCAGEVVGCTVLIRSQGGDACNQPPAGCGAVGPYSDLTSCQIGIVRRQLVSSPAACPLSLQDEMARHACQEYISKGRQPGFDPTKPIVVSYSYDAFDSAGYVDLRLPQDGGKTVNNHNTTCAALGVPGSALGP